MKKMSRKKLFFGILMISFSVLISLLTLILPITISMNRVVDIDAFDKQHGDYALLFFGFPGCATACPLALPVLDLAYKKFNENLNADQNLKLLLLFVDLEKRNSLSETQEYVEHFNSAFSVLDLDDTQMEKAILTFGLDFSEPDDNGQIAHRGYTYLIERKPQKKWVIRFVYSNGTPKVEQILSDLNSLID